MPSPNATKTTRADLSEGLLAIGLRAVAGELDDLLSRAGKGRWSAEELLGEITRTEQRDRERRSLERRMKRSRVGRYKPMADFDWRWPKKIDREAIERALRGDLLREKENLVLVAAQGLGKTMIARNLVHEAVLNGYSALFTEASRMLLDLGSQETSRALERRMRHYTRPHLLVIDEVGYLSYDARAADLLFEIISRRHEERSTVVTTNLAFKDWPTVFPNASCVAALVDRLTHRAEIVQIEGESFRKREAEERRKARRKSRGQSG